MFSKMHPVWRDWLKKDLTSPKLQLLLDSIARMELQGRIVYPPYEQRLRAFEYNPLDVRVVIVGQDPYHGKEQAHGLAFSVNSSVSIPPPVRNIYEELGSDIPDIPLLKTGNLSAWTDQGVLLLNSILTVEAGRPASHRNKGWEELTDAALFQLSRHRNNLVFILWGNYAAEKKVLIAGSHCIISSPHPSPFAAYTGFFGSKPFSKTNDYLSQHGRKIINWNS